MVIDLALDFTQVVAVARRLGVDARPAVTRELEASMHRVILPGQRVAVARSRKDTGRLRSDISNRVEAVPGGVIGQLTAKVPYAPVMEAGRRPGGRLPPKGVLVRSGWLRRHGIPDSKEFVIRRAIARRGIKGDHNIENAVKDRATAARAEFAGVGPRVVQRLVKGTR